MKISDKKEIDKVLSGHGLNESFRKHIISLFEKKEKEFIKKLKKTICPEFVWEDIDKLAGDKLI